MINFILKTIKQTFIYRQTTVEHAYQLLLDEGYIYSRPRSGYFVSEIESLTIFKQSTLSLLFLMMILINQKASDEAFGLYESSSVRTINLRTN